MPFYELGRTTATSAATGTTAVYSATLPITPPSGSWIIAAYYTNRGGNNVHTINSVILSGFSSGATVIISGYKIEAGQTSRPEIWGIPLPNGASVTNLQTSWTEGLSLATTLYQNVLVFSGASTTITGIAAFAFRDSGGSFDGAGGNTFGNTGGLSTGGTLTWTNSAGNIPTNYDSQKEPFIAAFYNSSASVNPTTPKQLNAVFGATVQAGGILTTDFATAGNLLVASTTNVAVSGKGVLYSPSGNFVFNYIATPQAGVLSGCTTNAPVGTVIPPYSQAMLPINTTATIMEITPSTDSFAGTLSGFQTGNPSYTSTSTANGYVQQQIAGGTTTGRLTLIGGSATGPIKTSAYGQFRIGGTGVVVGGGSIYTFVPATRNLTRASKTTLSSSNTSIRQKLWNRIVNITLSLTSSVSKYMTRIRFSTLAQNQSISIDKRASKPRSIILNQINSINSVKRTNFVRSIKTSLSQSIVLNRKLLHLRSVTARQSSTINLLKSGLSIRNIRINLSQSILLSKNSLRKRFSTISQIRTINTSKYKLANRSLKVSFAQRTSITRYKRSIRSAVTKLSFTSRIGKRSTFKRKSVITQSVTATVIRRKTTKRGVSVTSSYTIGTNRRTTFRRRAVASASMSIQTTKVRAKVILITATASILESKTFIKSYLVISNASWKMSSSINAKIIIPAKALFNNQMIASSPDYQRPDTTDFDDQNQTQISDDVPTEVVEIDDELGTSVVPFVE